MIDAKKVKKFWEGRAKRLGSVAFESIANLEEDSDALAEKIRVETENVFSYLGDISNKSIADLGAGVGQWSFRFHDAGAAHVTAVEYAASLVEIGRKEAAKRDSDSVEFVVSPAEQFKGNRTYDIVYISGLFVYLNDDQVAELMPNLPGLLHEKSIVVLRDGTGVPNRHQIDQKMSDHLGAEYSAIYRTKEAYLNLFSAVGLKCIRDQNMFPEHHPLNKYPETRLRLYRFECS